MAKSKKNRSRSWLVTQSCEKISFEDLQDALKEYVYIGQKEKGTKGGEQGYEHYQIYIENPNAIRFDTLKSKLPNAHIEPRRGTKKEAYEYVTKSETKIGENFGNGVIDITESQGTRNDITEILDMVKRGASDMEIENDYPLAMFRYPKLIEQARQRYLRSKYESSFRKLQVTYIWGAAGSGKTRYVMEKYGYNNVYRVTNYKLNPFDDYAGQKVIMFEEFRSSLEIERMLTLLDGYPLELPCRYSNKIACFEIVYIVTNIPLVGQYVNMQSNQPETWKAFLRRIHYLWHFGHTPAPLPMIKDKDITLLTVLGDKEDLPF